MSCTITATREYVATYADPNQHVWPLKVTVTTEGIDAEIFVYHVAVVGSAYAGDIFECVASVSQLSEIPKTIPVEGIPYYRLAVMQFACRSAQEAETLWGNIMEDIQDLVQNYNALTALTAEETVLFS